MANAANRPGSVRHRHGEPRCIDLLALDSALGERKAKVARLIDHRLTGIAGWASLGSTRGCPFPDRPACSWASGPRQGTGDEMAPGVTSGLNLTENRRFEFAVAAAAGAVD